MQRKKKIVSDLWLCKTNCERRNLGSENAQKTKEVDIMKKCVTFIAVICGAKGGNIVR